MAMKKMMAILYASIFALGILAGCSSGNSGTSGTTNTTNGGGTSQTETKSGLLSTSYADIMKSGKYLMHYKTTMTVENQTITSETTMAIDGNLTSMITEIVGDNPMKTHEIIKDDTIYVINDAAKTYYKMTISNTGTDTTPSVEDQKIDTTGITYTGKGKAELNGKLMDYEEYTVGKGTLRYYFDGGKLQAVAFKTGDSEVVMEIIELSNKVTSDMFEIPSDYKEATTY